MLPVRRLPPVRLRPRRRRHHRRRRPWAVVLTTGFARRRRAVTPAAALLTGLAAVATALVGAPAAASGASVAAAGAPAAASVAAAGAPATAAGASADRKQPSAGSYIPPVDAPIADPFRPPAGPYGAGNRGLEYATEPGTPVRASAAGAVTFAGPVAGALHVTVLHADGVRTSYSFLAGVEVVLGQQVQQGDRLGVSGERLHFGARAGDAYFDPAGLFAGTFAEVELLPFEEAPGNTPDAEARALAEMALADGGWRASLPGLGDTLTWLRDRARTGVIYVDQLNPLGRGLDVAGDLADRLLFRGPCSAGRAPVRPIAGQRRVAVTVAGLGSSSDAASIDDLRTDDLGYDRDRVVRFSYAGGRTPTTGAAFGGIDARPYAAADTLGDVAVVAGRLADVVGQVAAADPDAIVDVFAHSLGGLVTRLALVELRDRGFDLGRLGVVTTLGSPHRGADAATAVVAANTRPGANLALDAVERVLGTGLDPDAPVVGQLAEHSAVVARLRADGVPAGVRLVSIAARGDLVAAAPRTEIAGAVNITVPVMGPAAHGGLVGSDAATVEMARALAGQHPGCESWDDAVADVVTGHAVSAVEDHVGATGAMGW